MNDCEHRPEALKSYLDWLGEKRELMVQACNIIDHETCRDLYLAI